METDVGLFSALYSFLNKARLFSAYSLEGRSSIDCIHLRLAVTPLTAPPVVRHCSGCGRDERFVSSGMFRMNGNGALYDVWLIFKCTVCKTTWKLDIMSRVRLDRIDRHLFDAFVENAPDTAMRYAFDKHVHDMNKSTPLFDEVELRVDRQVVDVGCARNEIELVCDYPVRAKLVGLISDALGLSRTCVKRMLDSGEIYGADETVSSKTVLTSRLVLVVLTSLGEEMRG